MGRAAMGGQKRLKNLDMLNPQQRQLFDQLLTNLGPQFQEAYSSFIGGPGQEEIQDVFEKTYLNPAMQAYQRNILPAIQEQFTDAGASGALNQALAQSATDLATSLGQAYGGFYDTQRARQLQALQGFQPFITQPTSQPMYQQQQGILGPLLQTGGQLGAAYLGSPYGFNIGGLFGRGRSIF